MPLDDAQAEEAPAKINLALHVVGRRDDGYHLIESLSVFAAFGDRVTVAPSDRDTFDVTGPFAGMVPLDTGNLVLRAREAFRARFPSHASQPFAIVLDKNIPVASGVGGGSSDAAATLRALARFCTTDAVSLAALAPTLGADVPMCLMAKPLIARGIGDVLEPAPGLPPFDIVLVNPGVEVATPRVFAALSRRSNPPLPPLPDRTDVSGLLDWLRSSRNDLMQPAITIAPEIADALEALTGQGAAFARMSGSGATCFGIFGDAVAARRAADAIGRARPHWFSIATRTGA